MPSDQGDGHSKWTDYAFGGGIILYAISSTITGVWWASTIDGDVQDLKDADSGFEQRLDKLDNIALGNRITAVEVRIGNTERVLDNIDRKMDRLLARRSPQDPG